MELQSESAIMQQSKMHLPTLSAKDSSAFCKLQSLRVNVHGLSLPKAEIRLSMQSPKANKRDALGGMYSLKKCASKLPAGARSILQAQEF
jgi:hypothetical protein